MGSEKGNLKGLALEIGHFGPAGTSVNRDFHLAVSTHDRFGYSNVCPMRQGLGEAAMARKHSIGELISIRYSDRSSTVEGLVIDYNDDWTLMRSNPVDYVLDGFVILRHRNIAGYRRGEPEKFTEKIFKLKGISVASEDTVPLDDLGTILRYLTDRFDIFQFETRAEKQCYLGRLISIDSKVLTIDYLDTRGKWTGPRQFRPGDVRVIGFDTDYINSLKLVARKRRRSRL